MRFKNESMQSVALLSDAAWSLQHVMKDEELTYSHQILPQLPRNGALETPASRHEVRRSQQREELPGGSVAQGLKWSGEERDRERIGCSTRHFTVIR